MRIYPSVKSNLIAMRYIIYCRSLKHIQIKRNKYVNYPGINARGLHLARTLAGSQEADTIGRLTSGSYPYDSRWRLSGPYRKDGTSSTHREGHPSPCRSVHVLCTQHRTVPRNVQRHLSCEERRCKAGDTNILKYIFFLISRKAVIGKKCPAYGQHSFLPRLKDGGPRKGRLW